MRYGNTILNVLTIAVLTATAGVCALAAVITINPTSPLNPYPPAALPRLAVLPSATFTPTLSPFATLPPALTPTARATSTPAATNTLVVNDSPTPDISATPDETQIAELTAGAPTETQEATNTSAPTPKVTKTRSAFQFNVQGGGPIPLSNTFNGSGCNWMGIGGQAYDLDGAPIPFYIVHLEGGGLNADAITGSQQAYGEGGYEFFLDNHPKQTVGEFKVQLFDQKGKLPLSDVVVVDTFADCAKNLLMVNFVQNH